MKAIGHAGSEGTNVVVNGVVNGFDNERLSLLIPHSTPLRRHPQPRRTISHIRCSNCCWRRTHSENGNSTDLKMKERVRMTKCWRRLRTCGV